MLRKTVYLMYNLFISFVFKFHLSENFILLSDTSLASETSAVDLLRKKSTELNSAYYISNISYIQNYFYQN